MCQFRANWYQTDFRVSCTHNPLWSQPRPRIGWKIYQSTNDSSTVWALCSLFAAQPVGVPPWSTSNQIQMRLKIFFLAAAFVFVSGSSAATMCQAEVLMMVYFLVGVWIPLTNTHARAHTTVWQALDVQYKKAYFFIQGNTHKVYTIETCFYCFYIQYMANRNSFFCLCFNHE